MPRVRLRLGPDEIEVEGDVPFIEKYLETFTTKWITRRSPFEAQTPSQIVESSRGMKAVVPMAPAEFVKQKNPKTGTETLIVLAKYLEDHRNAPDFSPSEINALAREAKIPDIHSQYFTYAVQQGLARTMEKGRYALTLSGEDAVLAMPKK